MRYYFGPPPQIEKCHDYTVLYDQLVPSKLDYIPKSLMDEYSFFILESCRLYVDGMDKEEIQSYYELTRSAYDNLLIHRDKIESYFKEYIHRLFSYHKPMIRNIPTNISETVIDIMLSELDIGSILKHVDLGTQEVDVQSIKDSVKLEKINAVKRLHDRVLFLNKI